MNKQREALEMVLAVGYTSTESPTYKIIKEALAEPEPWTPDDMAYRPGGLPMDAEQEPVAWMMVNEEHGHKPTLHWKPQEDWHITWKAVPLYTAPPTRADGNHFGDVTEMAAAAVPLTDEQMRTCAQAMDAEPLSEGWPELIKFARAIERAHGIGE